MLVSEIPVAFVDGVEPITLRCDKPFIMILEGILGIGKSFATAYWCAGKPKQLGLWGLTLGEQTPDLEPLYINLEGGGEKARFWYVEEITKDLGEYYDAIYRYTKGIDKEPSPVIADFQGFMMLDRQRQAEMLIPEIIEKGLYPVVDRGPWGDAYVFAQNLINMGAIKGDSLKNYERLRDKTLDAWNNMRKSFGVETVVVYLLAEKPEIGVYDGEATQMTADIAFKRKDVRNRSAEKPMTPDYMYRLNDLYNELFGSDPSFDLGPIVPVNTGIELEVDPRKEVELLRVIAEGICDVCPGAYLL